MLMAYREVYCSQQVSHFRRSGSYIVGLTPYRLGPWSIADPESGKPQSFKLLYLQPCAAIAGNRLLGVRLCT
jgi:hypothetical protein